MTAPARRLAAAVRVKAEPGAEGPGPHTPAAAAAAAAAAATGAAGAAPARRALPPATPTWRPATLAASAEVSDARGQPQPAQQQQQQQLPTPSPASERPARASERCQPSAQAAGSDSVAAALAAQRAQLAEQKKQEARAALCGVQAADPGPAALAALRCLALARAGGPRLRVRGWVRPPSGSLGSACFVPPGGAAADLPRRPLPRRGVCRRALYLLSTPACCSVSARRLRAAVVGLANPPCPLPQHAGRSGGLAGPQCWTAAGGV